MASAAGAAVTIVHNGMRERIVFDKTRPLSTALDTYCAKYGLDVRRTPSLRRLVFLHFPATLLSTTFLLAC